MELFDLHCDTLLLLADRREDLINNNNQFSLRGLSHFTRLCQTLAVFLPDDIRGAEAGEYFDRYYHYFQYLMKCRNAPAAQAMKAADIAGINAKGKCAVFLSVESGAALNGSLSRIAYLKECGVKIMTITWNGPNELASGHDDEQTGFTEFGRKAVAELEKNKIIVDVSHMNDKGFDELCTFAERPFIASHSNLRSVCSHRRNLTEPQFAEIVRRGGLAGINLVAPILDNEGKGGKESVLRHIYRMLELGGEDAIACGSDFDGAVMCGTFIDRELDSTEKFGALAEYFSKEGISDTVIRKIFFDNALSFFTRMD